MCVRVSNDTVYVAPWSHLTWFKLSSVVLLWWSLCSFLFLSPLECRLLSGWKTFARIWEERASDLLDNSAPRLPRVREKETQTALQCISWNAHTAPSFLGEMPQGLSSYQLRGFVLWFVANETTGQHWMWFEGLGPYKSIQQFFHVRLL